MGKIFVAVERWWGTLTPLRRFLLETSVTWAVTGIATYLLGRFSSVVTWSPLVVTMTYLREYFLNGYVASALASALVVGFWSYIASWFRATAPILRALWPIGALLIVAIVVPSIMDWWEARDDPRLFHLPPRAESFAHKANLPLIEIEPADLAKLYVKNTTVAGDALARPYIGRYMAITGRIYDVGPPDGNTLAVNLRGHVVAARLQFEDQNRGPIWRLRKDQRVKAFCQLDGISDAGVRLSGCALIP